jgi:hypothetical protein
LTWPACSAGSSSSGFTDSTGTFTLTAGF